MGNKIPDHRQGVGWPPVSQVSERWLPVVGYEGCYEVSDQGHVRSIDRIVSFVDGRRRFYKGQACKTKLNNQGYPLVLLSRGMARKRWRSLHLVVLAAFKGPCPTGLEGCHNDGCPANAALTNLRYDTRVSNMADKRKHGTHREGANHHSARFPAATVAAVKRARGTMDELAARFGMSRTHIWNIQNEKRRSSG